MPPIDGKGIDLGLVYVSSLYDGQFSPSAVVPCILDVCNQNCNVEGEEALRKLVGCYSGGVIGSTPIPRARRNEKDGNGKACLPLESEGTHGVTVTLCVLPDTSIQVCTSARTKVSKFLQPDSLTSFVYPLFLWLCFTFF